MTVSSADRTAAALISGNQQCAKTVEIASDVQAAAEQAAKTHGTTVGYSTQQPRFNPAVAHTNCYYEGTSTRVLDTARIASPIFTVRPASSHAETPVIQRELWVKESGDPALYSMQPLALSITPIDVARGKVNELLGVTEPSSAQRTELANAEHSVLTLAGEKLRVLDSKPKLSEVEKFERAELRDEVLKYGVPYLRELRGKDQLTPAEHLELEGRTGLEQRIARYSAELFNSAAIEDPELAAAKAALPKGVTAQPKDVTKLQTKGAASLDQSHQILEVNNGAGTVFTISTGSANSLKENEDDWRAAVKAGETARWESSSTVTSVGAAGKLMSVMLAGSQDTGGQLHVETAFNTWDTRSGKQVKLDALLSPQQMNELVTSVDAQLLSLVGEDLPGDVFAVGGRDALRAHINENFTLRTGADGKVTIDVAWQSGVGGPLMAHFQLDAPKTPEFRRAIALE